ncbi:MAG: hypothetical protein WBF83_04830 [Moheibacter sp.]
MSRIGINGIQFTFGVGDYSCNVLFYTNPAAFFDELETRCRMMRMW